MSEKFAPLRSDTGALLDLIDLARSMHDPNLYGEVNDVETQAACFRLLKLWSKRILDKYSK